jgi:putative hemolysin
MHELDQIADPIADMETDGKGIPILIKHYSRLGGRLIGFNVDAKFSHVLDGLVVMDLRQTQPSSLERYMGKSGLASFRRYHGLPASQDRY